MKTRILTIAIILASAVFANAQQMNITADKTTTVKNTIGTSSTVQNKNSFLATTPAKAVQPELAGLKKHEIKTFYSTAYPGDLSDIFTVGLANIFSGNEWIETSTFGMVGVGYRYQLKKFLQVGIDLGYSQAKENAYARKEDKTPARKYNITRYMAMPTVDFSYWRSRNNIVNLYGSAGAGIMYTSKKEKTDANAKAIKSTEFAYQVNPIGVRVGNNTIGGFVEAGYGNKGFLTAGISLKF